MPPASRLFTLSGIDCSGKSTQIALLADYLRARGHDPIVFWYRPGYSRELDALRALIRRARPGVLPNPRVPGAHERAFRGGALRGVWARLALIDMALQYGARVRGLLSRGRTVICDRYTWDGIIDLELRFPELNAARWHQTRLAVRATPRPDTSLLLELPYDEVAKRVAQKREPFPDSENVRAMRYRAYRELLAANHYLKCIDADAPIDIVHQRVVEALAGVI